MGTIIGPLGKDWKQFKFSIGSRPAGYLLELYVLPLYDNYYDIFTDVAIDDVKLENCAVQSLPQNLSLDCTFENGFCDYFLDNTADFLWQRTNVATTTANTNPGFDRKITLDFAMHLNNSKIFSQILLALVIMHISNPHFHKCKMIKLDFSHRYNLIKQFVFHFGVCFLLMNKKKKSKFLALSFYLYFKIICLELIRER